MLDRRTALLAGLGAGAATPALAQHPEDADLRGRRLAHLHAFADAFYHQKSVRLAFEQFVSEQYIQHSRGIPQGREGAIAVLEPMFNRPEFVTTVERILLDGDFALIVVRAQISASVEALVLDLFRFEGEQIVEHWDAKSEIPPEDRPGFFDGFAKP